MTIRNQRELGATREKLRLLEQRYHAKQDRKDGDAHVRDLTLRSMKRMINQLKEEITRFEAHSPTGS